ncbi:MAG: NUDIX hydrolase [Patescibacteria group bacterium]
MIEYIWHENTNVEGLSPVTQVYGVCFDEMGRILLLRQKGHGWNIPGGTPEAGETPSETLIREVYEETTVRIGAHELIGYQEVVGDKGSPYYQLRYAAIVERVDSQQPDPDKGETHERLFIAPEDAMTYITYPQYRGIFEAAIKWYRKK